MPATNAAVTMFWDVKASGVLEFVSTIITAVAWPLAATFIVGLFRKEIIERIPKLSELTLPGGISARFNERLEKVEAEVVQAPEEPRPTVRAYTEDAATPTVSSNEPVSTAEVLREQNDRLALRANPTGVVMEAWKSLEQVLRMYATETLGKPVGKGASRSVVSSLHATGAMSKEDHEAILELIELRNLVAHAPDKTISDTEAFRFSGLARRFENKYMSILAEALLKRGVRPAAPPQ